MKKFFVFLMILAFALIPIAAGPPQMGDVLALSAVQAVTVNSPVFESTFTEVLAIPIEAVYSLVIPARARRGTARTPGANPKTRTAGAPPIDSVAAVAVSAKKGKRTVEKGQIRRFECTAPCYWDQTRYRDAQELGRGQGDVVEFAGPTEIPSDFQFENWREF
jgi:hypothetical protein